MQPRILAAPPLVLAIAGRSSIPDPASGERPQGAALEILPLAAGL